MDDIITKKLIELGWSENTRYPNTDRWHFLEIRNFNILKVVCVIKDQSATPEEVKELKSYLNRLSPRFSLKGMGLGIVFSNSKEFLDLSMFISKYREAITVQKIIQVTPDKVYVQSTWLVGYMDRFLGNFVEDIAGSRDVVQSKIDGGIMEIAVKKNWLLYAVLFMALCSILQFFLK